MNKLRFLYLLFGSFFFSSLAFSHGISDAAKAAMLEGGYLKYIWLGATHMLTGYDHLLFIFGVIFFLNTFKDVVKFISVFTVGHCITLIFATFFKITANYFLVDAVIALSVMYKGYENLDGFKKHFDLEMPSLLKMVFVFGLIHGFGLSTRLQQLPLGDDATEMLIRILSFNVGVEVGQVAALGAMIVVLKGFRHSTGWVKFSKIANTLLILGGAFLFMMQSHGYWHETMELHINEDVHKHIHEDMESSELEDFE
jgi:hypothetical protein